MESRKLDELPRINILEDEGITLDGIMSEMVSDYEAEYKNITGNDIKLYPGNRDRIQINIYSGQYYQMYQLINKYFNLNFLNNMYGKYLESWGGNIGFTETGLKAAEARIRFSISEALGFAVAVPAGTRVTAGDNVYFATEDYAEIAAGETYTEVKVVCTEEGTVGNGYAAGQINILVDPINYISDVQNITVSSGGNDKYTDEELKEILFMYPSTSSTTGTEDEYKLLVKRYSSDIVDVAIDTEDDATVNIYFILDDGELPDSDYCDAVKDFILEQDKTPITDTDQIELSAPTAVHYDIVATYYVASSKREMVDEIQSNVTQAAEEFKSFTHSNIGNDINPDLLVAYANAAGAKRINITSPTFTAVGSKQIGICDSVTLTYGGLEDD